MSLQTPVAFIIFNRPHLARQALGAIAAARPKHLLVIADGPRHDDERVACEASRRLIDELFDWPCTVDTCYGDTNLGCKYRVASGIDWVFERVDRAIIIEDDVVCDPSFFPFCQELLERYEDEPRVGMISGDALVDHPPPASGASYRFTRVPNIWGWATWRRAWDGYDVELRNWREPTEGSPDDWLGEMTMTPNTRERYARLFDETAAGRVDSWDGQWVHRLWSRRQLSVAPMTNLVRNVGFGADATHTRRPDDPMSRLQAGSVEFPLVHPGVMRADHAWDRALFDHLLGQ